MEEQEEDYFAPLGVSPFDFSSMIRRRFLAHLTRQLIEQGRVSVPGAAVIPNTTAQPTERSVANTPEPSVTDERGVSHPAGWVYSRDMDDVALCSATPDTPDTPCSCHTCRETQSLDMMSLSSARNSVCASFSGFSLSAPLSATSASIQRPFPNAATVAKEFRFPRRLYSLVKEALRVPSMTTLPLRAPANADYNAVNFNHAPGQRIIHQRARSPVFPVPETPLADLPIAIAALLHQYERRNEPKILQPPVDQVF